MSTVEKEQKGITRRDFVKGAAAGAVGGLVVGGGGAALLMPKAEPKAAQKVEAPWLPAKWDMEADVLIVGTGLGGCSAAIEATRAGAGVLILEQYGEVRGCIGVICACGTKWQEAAGIKDSVDLMFADSMRAGQNKADPELVRILCEQSADALYFLEALGHKCTGVKLGEDTNMPRTHRGFSGAYSGPLLSAAIEKNGGKFMFNTMLTGLFREGYLEGKVVGARAVGQDGKELTIKAKRAIILATGPWRDEAKMVFKEWPTLTKDKVVLAASVHGKSGQWADAIKAAQVINAATRHMAYVGLGPYETVFPEGTAELTKTPQQIHINLNGKRFVNEGSNRGTIGEAISKQPQGIYFAIQDSNPKIFGPNLMSTIEQVDTWVKEGKIGRANTIKELADWLEKKYGIPAATVVETVTNYNKYCETGVDPEFGKPSYDLLKVEVPPFYGGVYTYKVNRTLGGLHANAKSQVLDLNGEVIPLLYAAGMCAGGHHGQYWITGNQQCDATVFGRIAGKEVAALKPWA